METLKIGDTVLYWPAANDSKVTSYSRAKPMVGIVAYVHGDQLSVNLTVFDHQGVPHSRPSTPFVARGAPTPRAGDPYCAVSL